MSTQPEQLYLDRQFPWVPDRRPLVLLNMVTSLDGRTTINRRLQSGSLGSTTDRLIMGNLRSLSDAVICGAQTIREHPYYLGVRPELVELRCSRGLPEQPLTIIVANRGSLPWEAALFTSAPRRPLVLIPQTSPLQHCRQLREVADVLSIGKDSVDLPAALNILRCQAGIERLVLEGGAHLNRQFFELQLIDHIFLTIAPKVVGGTIDRPLVAGTGPLDEVGLLQLCSVFTHESEIFLHYQVKKDRGQ